MKKKTYKPYSVRRNLFWSFFTLALTVGLWSLAFTAIEKSYWLGFQHSLALWATVIIHEYGHFYAARYMGLQFTHPIYIVIGAFVKPVPIFKFHTDGTVSKHEPDLKGFADVVVSMGGPVIGLVGTFVTGLLYLITDFKVFLVMTAAGFTINMFNLLPLFPLDGGRVVNRLHAGYMAPATLASLPVVWFWNDPLMWLVGALGTLFTIIHVGNAYYNPADMAKEYVKEKDRARIAALYATVFFIATAGYLLLRYSYSGPIILG